MIPVQAHVTQRWPSHADSHTSDRPDPSYCNGADSLHLSSPFNIAEHLGTF
jgi:hypothetical protein